MSTGDYAKAVWLPSPNFWPGGDGNQLIVVHATASGGPQTGYQLATSAEFTDGQSNSTHYINDVDGTVYQIVREADSAWGNCCVDGNSPFSATYNWNKNTISIENVKHSSDNSEPLTAAQYQSLLALVRDIASRNAIPLVHGSPTMKGIIFHHDLMPIIKGRCPGTFPYGTFFQDLQGGGTQTLQTTHDGMVMNIPKSNQLTTGESFVMCTVWAPAAINFCAPPGQNALADGSAQENPIDDLAELWWSTHSGEMPADVEWCLTQATYPGSTHRNLYYRVITPTRANITRALQAGYIVLATANEANVLDVMNGDRQAYGWSLGNHFFPLAGLSGSNYIAADQLIGRQGYWPPVYDAGALNPSYAVVVQVIGPDPAHPWLAPIPPGDPSTWPSGYNAQLFAGGTTIMGIPTGWKPGPNNSLIAPNLVPVTGGNSIWVQGHSWDSNNLPIKAEMGRTLVEQSNPALGSGTWQNFRGTPGQPAALAWRKDTNQVYLPWAGQELDWYMNAYEAAQAQIAVLKAQVAALQAAGTGAAIPQAVLDDIKSLAALIPPAALTLETLVKDAGLPPLPTP